MFELAGSVCTFNSDEPVHLCSILEAPVLVLLEITHKLDTRLVVWVDKVLSLLGFPTAHIFENALDETIALGTCDDIEFPRLRTEKGGVMT